MKEIKTSKKAIWGIIFCIPLVLIAYFVITSVSQTISVDNIKSIKITTPDENTYDINTADDIKFFIEGLLNSQELKEPVRELTEDDVVLFECDRGDKIISYKIYPEVSENGCMFTDPEGKLHLFPASVSRELLMRNEFEYLYSPLYLPSLKLSSGSRADMILPESGEWQYKKINNEFVEYKPEFKTDTTVYSVYSNRENSFEFDIKPDYMLVQFYDKDGLLVQGQSLAELLFPTDTILTAKITAEWNKASAKKYYGEAVYTIDILYDIPAEITLWKSEIVAGDLLIINAKNLNPLEVITLEGNNDLNIKFSQNSGVMTAVLKIPAETKPGEYSLGFKVGDNTANVTYTVTACDSEFYRVSMSSELFNLHLSEIAQTELKELLKSFVLESSGTCYSDPLIALTPIVSSTEVIVSMNDDILVNIDSSVESFSVKSPVEVYKTTSNTKIKAAKTGKIVYTGSTTMLGDIVIIDHGCGMLTWYFGFAEITRSVGMEVNAGDILGSSGGVVIGEANCSGYGVTAGFKN